MYYWILFCISYSLFAQSTSSILSGASNGSVAVFPITPTQRGNDLISMFSTLSSAPYKTASSQIAFQTTRNGLVSWVQNIQPATNSTIFIMTFGPTTDPSYTVVFTEQIVEIIWSRQAIPSNGVFGSTNPVGVLPIFSMDMSQRAVDIKNILFLLTTQFPYKNFYVPPSVNLQTTLFGPFYSPLINGLIPNVQNISLTQAPNGTLMLVDYRPSNQLQMQSIVVAPDQVYGITFTQL